MNAAEKEARARLAERISEHNAIESELSKTQGILADAKRELGMMLDEADQSEARKAEEMDAEVTRILSGAPAAKVKPQSPALTEGDLALQRRLVERLEALVDESEYSLSTAKRAIAAGVSAVVVARVHDMVPEFEKARAEFAKLAAAFSAARSGIEHDRDGPYDRVDRLLRQEPGAAGRFAGLAPTEEAKWRSAIAQLARNPDAPLH